MAYNPVTIEDGKLYEATELSPLEITSLDTPTSGQVASNDPTGFDSTDTIALGTLAFDDPSMTFTHGLNGGDIKYWRGGSEITKTVAQSVAIDDTEGLWFIYYNESDVLVSSQVPWDFDNGKVFVALVYWDATNNKAILLGEERHGISMDWATHKYEHNSVGAVWISGYTPSVTADGSGNVNADAEMQSIAQGTFYDEDLINSNLEQTTYEFWWKEGANGDWRSKATSPALVYNQTLVSTRPYWNELTGGTWQLTEVGNNDFTLSHIFATNEANGTNKVRIIMGEGDYATASQARDAAEVELASLQLNGLPTVEFVPIATVIIQCRDTYANDYNARVIPTDDGFDYIDWRENDKVGSGGASASHHGNLTGLGDDDHLQYSRVDGTRAFTSTVGGVDGVAATDLATVGQITSAGGAFLKLDTSNGPLTGDLGITKIDPEIRLTDSGNSEYTRVTKSDTSNIATRYNRVDVVGGIISDMVAQWKLNETDAGTAIADTTGTYNGVHSIANSSRTITGKINGAMGFYNTASVDKITVGTTSPIAGESEISFTFWIRTASGGQDPAGTIFAQYDTTGNSRAFRLGVNSSGQILWIVYASDGTNTNRFLVYTDIGITLDDEWNHVSITYNTSTRETHIYIDESERTLTDASSGAQPAQIYDTGADVTIGSDSQNAIRAYCGLDDLRIYSKSLSSLERSSIYNSGSGTEENNAPSSTVEIAVWKSEDSLVAQENGIQTFGDYEGRTIISGVSTYLESSEVYMPNDDAKLYQGAGDDYSQYFDGADQQFECTGDFVFNSDIVITNDGGSAELRFGDTTLGAINMPYNAWGDKWYFAGQDIKVHMDASNAAWHWDASGAGGLDKYKWTMATQGGIGSLLELNNQGIGKFYGGVSVRSAYVAGLRHKFAYTWEDSTDITGMIDTSYNGTTVDMYFGHLYNSGHNTDDVMVLTGEGHMKLPNDNAKLYQGEDDDYSQYFDGTDMQYDCTGKFEFNGPVTVDDGAEFYLDGDGFAAGANIWANTTMRIGCKSGSSLAMYTTGVNRLTVEPAGDVAVKTGHLTIEGATRRLYHGTGYSQYYDGSNFRMEVGEDFMYIASSKLHHGTTDFNTGFGLAALNTVTSGTYNCVLGRNALSAVTTAGQNVAIGGYAGASLVGGSFNNIIGQDAMRTATNSIQNNVAIGKRAGYALKGSNNVIVGHYAGYNAQGLNVMIGYYAGNAETGSNKLYIENSASSSPLIYGEFDNDLIRFNAAADMALLAVQPTGADDLAIATTKYVDDLIPTVVTNHAALSNLDYASAGHTGFAATTDLANYLRVDGTIASTGEQDFNLGLTVPANNVSIKQGSLDQYSQYFDGTDQQFGCSGVFAFNNQIETTTPLGTSILYGHAVAFGRANAANYVAATATGGYLVFQTAGSTTALTLTATGDVDVENDLQVDGDIHSDGDIDVDASYTGGHTVGGTATGGFVDRGDPSTFDYTTTNFTLDGTYRTLDLSSIIPVGVKAVVLRTQMTDGTAGNYFQFRKNGNTYNSAGNVLRVQVAGVYNDNMMIIPVDSSRQIEYRGIATTGNQATALDVTVTGWYI